MEVSLNYCSQNGGNLYRTPYYNRNLNIGPRIVSNLGQSPYSYSYYATVTEWGQYPRNDSALLRRWLFSCPSVPAPKPVSRLRFEALGFVRFRAYSVKFRVPGLGLRA